MEENWLWFFCKLFVLSPVSWFDYETLEKSLQLIWGENKSFLLYADFLLCWWIWSFSLLVLVELFLKAFLLYLILNAELLVSPDFTGIETNSSVKFPACSLTAYLGDAVKMQFSCFTSAVVHFAACRSEVCCCYWGYAYCWTLHPRYLHKSDPSGFPWATTPGCYGPPGWSSATDRGILCQHPHHCSVQHRLPAALCGYCYSLQQ